MKMIQATLTRQGQVTVPAEVRKLLGLTKPGRLTFVIDEDDVRLQAPTSTLDAIVGSLEPIPGTSVDWDEEIEAAMFEETKRLVRGRERE